MTPRPGADTNFNDDAVNHVVMNVQFNSGAVSTSARAPGSAGALRRNFFLVTPSDEQCGVESFARLLVNELNADYPAAGYGLLPVSPRWRDLPALLRQVRHADCIVFSVPLTSWKKLLLLPLVVLLFARCVGCRVRPRAGGATSSAWPAWRSR